MNNVKPRRKLAKMVAPIQRQADLEKIRRVLANRPRDTLLFELAIATGLQAKQLLQLSASDLRAMLNERNEGSVANNQWPKLPVLAKAAIVQYLAQHTAQDGEYVFRSRKGNAPLTVASASRLVGSWFEQAGISGLRGLLSLRKTYEYHQSYITAPKTDNAQITDNEYKMEPIRAVTLNESIYNKLESMIVSGQLPPGTKLVAGQLAKQMKVSTIPMREALARLEAREFITRIPKKGFVINRRSIESILELLEVRMILESAALKKAVPKIKPETILLLEKANERYSIAWKAWDVDALLKAAKHFHDLLYRDANITVMKKLIDQVWDGINPYYHIMFKQQEGPRHTGAPYHEMMIKGIKTGDVDQVIDWLIRDMKDAMTYVSETLKSMSLAD